MSPHTISIFITLAVALLGIFSNTSNIMVKYILGFMAVCGFFIAYMIDRKNNENFDFLKKSLSHLVQATRPSELFRKGIIDSVVKQLDKKGFCLIKLRLVENNALFYILNTKNEEVIGLYTLKNEKIASLVTLDKQGIEQELVKALFLDGPAIEQDYNISFNSIVDYTSELLYNFYPDYYTDGPVELLLDSDSMTITVPKKEVIRNGKSIVLPTFTFSRSQLSELIGKSYIEASQSVINSIRQHWGKPNI